MSDSTVPRPALVLGLAGLLPSVAVLGAMLALPDWREGLARAGLAYGAAVASFVGGAWWGLACARAEAPPARILALSAVPALIAWPAALLPPPTGLAVLAATFVAMLPTDARLQREGIAPGWWVAMRRVPSAGMAALHAAAAVVVVAVG